MLLSKISLIDSAMELYYMHKPEWQALMVRAMRADFSWNKSVQEYAKLYEGICES